MQEYEQMEFDVTLESERDLKENVQVAVDFACRQPRNQNLPTVESRHEGYGIMAEQTTGISKSMKNVSDGMKNFLAILSAGDSDAVNAASNIYNAACEVAYEAVKMASHANRVMTDLYHNQPEQTTPLEEYLEDQEDDGFEETEDADQEEDADGED